MASRQFKRRAFQVGVQLGYLNIMPDLDDRIYSAVTEEEVTRILTTCRCWRGAKSQALHFSLATKIFSLSPTRRIRVVILQNIYLINFICQTSGQMSCFTGYKRLSVKYALCRMEDNTTRYTARISAEKAVLLMMG